MPQALAQNADAYDPQHPEKLTSENIRAEAAILIDADTGEVLFEKKADERLYPASTTKIMTLFLGVTRGDFNQTLVATPSCLYVAGDTEGDSSMLPLKEGQEINFHDLLCATKVNSANDGANLIAEAISGSQEAFVALMNETAYHLGCQNTHFNNAHGYQDEYHFSTVRDMALISKEAMKNEDFREIAKMTKFTLPKNNINKGATQTSQDHIMMVETEGKEDYYYPFANGIKTGRHSLAGSCYVGSASKDGINLISVVFKERSYERCFADTKRLMEYGFSQYISTTIEELYSDKPRVVDIARFANSDKDLGRLVLDIRKVNPEADDHVVSRVNSTDKRLQSYLKRTTIDLNKELVAPIQEGDVMGRMTYTPEGNAETIEYELIASRSIAARVSIAPTIEEINQYSDADPNPFPRFSFEYLLFLLIPLGLIAALSQLMFKVFTREKKPRLKQKKSGGGTRYFR